MSVCRGGYEGAREGTCLFDVQCFERVGQRKVGRSFARREVVWAREWSKQWMMGEKKKE